MKFKAIVSVYILITCISFSCKKSTDYDAPPVSSLNCSLTFDREYGGFASQNQTYSGTGGTNTIAQNTFGQVFLNTFVLGKYQPVGSADYINATYNIEIPMSFTQGTKITTSTYYIDSTKLTLPGFYEYMSYTDPNGNTYHWGLDVGQLPGAYRLLPAHHCSVTLTNIFTKYLSDGKTHTYADGNFDAVYFGGPDGTPASNGLSYIDGYAAANLGGNVEAVGSFSAFELVGF